MRTPLVPQGPHPAAKRGSAIDTTGRLAYSGLSTKGGRMKNINISILVAGLVVAGMSPVMAQVAPIAAPAAAAVAAVTDVDSSLLDKVAYDPTSQDLVITFQNGETYRYLQVPQAVYDSLMQAASKGQFFAQNIKGKFQFVKADGAAQ
jgi:high-affinity K+ transport system ATPase subunit B